MPVCQTQHFGPVEYDEGMVVHFGEGIPAFPDQTRFVLIEPPPMVPLIYLQSLGDPGLCFLTLPAACLETAYRLSIPGEELADLGARGEEGDLLVLAILTIPEEGSPTANLAAPVVIHRQTRKGR